MNKQDEIEHNINTNTREELENINKKLEEMMVLQKHILQLLKDIYAKTVIRNY